MGKKITASLMVLLMLSANLFGIKVKAAEEEVLPKVEFVGVSAPIVIGSKANFVVLTKYPGKVQYKVFVHEPGTSRKIWKEVTDEDFSKPIDAGKPYVFPSYDLDKEGEYDFAIRVKRAGVTGKHFNMYGDYDDAYAFTVKTVRSADVKPADIDVADDTYFTGEKININGFKGAKDLEYKLHTYNLDEGWKKDINEEYKTQIEKTFDKPGVYVLDLWGRNGKSKNNYDAFAVKTVNILERGPIEVKIEDLNEVRINFNKRVSKADSDNFYIDDKPLDENDSVKLMGNGTYAIIKRDVPFEQNQNVKVTLKNLKESDGKVIKDQSFNVKVSDTKIPKVSIDSLKEVNIEFGKKVSSISADNFLIDGKKLSDNDAVILSDDLKTAYILKEDLFLQKQKVNVKVKDIKYEDETTLSSFDYDLTASDDKAPSVLRVEQTGLKQMKVIFDEAILSFTADYIKIDNDVFNVNYDLTNINGRSVSFNLDKIIPAGSHKLKIGGACDYAGKTSLESEFMFDGIRDDKVPQIAKVEKATQNKVILEFTKDINLNVTDPSKYYHSDNKKAKRVETDGKKLIITFDDLNKMPEGVAYIYIPENAVVDSWKNYSEAVNEREIMVEADNDKPEVKSVKASKGSEIEVLFSEEIAEGGIFRIYDKDSKEISNNSFGVNYAAPDKVKLIFTKPLEAGNYTLSIEGIKDIAGNEMERDVEDAAIPDTVPPTIDTNGKLYSDKNIVRIFFSKPMDFKDISDPSNYQLNNVYLSKMNGVFINPENDYRSVAIYFKNGGKITSKDKIVVGKLKDASGNYTDEMSTEVSLEDQNAVGIKIENVKIIDKNTLAVNLNDSISVFEPEDFDFYINGIRTTPDSFEKEITGGKSKLIFKFKYSLNDISKMQVKTVSYPKTANEYGVKLKGNQTIQGDKISDCIPPDIESITFSSDRKQLYIRFTKNVKGDSMYRYSFTVSNNSVEKYEVVSNNQIKISLSEAAAYGSKISVSIRNVEDETGNIAELITRTVDVK